MKESLQKAYQEGAVEAAVLLKMNVWEGLNFSDMSESVVANMQKIELDIAHARLALIKALSSDPSMNDRRVAQITREVIIPHEIKRRAIRE